MMKYMAPLNAKQLEYVKNLHACGEHLLALINNLLDLSKIEANREELSLETVVVKEICLEALSLVYQRAKEQGIELILETEPDVTFCRSDPLRLKQILVNLLSNAIKFTEIGAVRLKVAQNGKTIDFSVIDTGIGIAEAEKDKLFQPFQQLNSHLHRNYKGTGLGLALSLRLARLHGGDISVTSKPGNGSCFTLHLPVTNNNDQ